MKQLSNMTVEILYGLAYFSFMFVSTVRSVQGTLSLAQKRSVGPYLSNTQPVNARGHPWAFVGVCGYLWGFVIITLRNCFLLYALQYRYLRKRTRVNNAHHNTCHDNVNIG